MNGRETDRWRAIEEQWRKNVAEIIRRVSCKKEWLINGKDRQKQWPLIATIAPAFVFISHICGPINCSFKLNWKIPLGDCQPDWSKIYCSLCWSLVRLWKLIAFLYYMATGLKMVFHIYFAGILTGISILFPSFICFWWEFLVVIVINLSVSIYTNLQHLSSSHVLVGLTLWLETRLQ